MLKSTADSFGIKFEGTGVTDVLQALGTKGALESRTADGTNLLPGAMSNYEDQLLKQVYPSLGFTQQGRLLQIQIMKAQMNQKIALAKAAKDYVRQHGSLDNKGWEDVSDAIAAKNPFYNDKRIAALQRTADDLMKGVK